MERRVLDDEAAEILRRLGPDAAVLAVPLSHRLKSELAALGVEVLAEAAELTERGLLSRAGIGRKSVAELCEALAVHGLVLRDSVVTEAATQQLLPLHYAPMCEGGPLLAELEELLRLGGVAEAYRAAIGRLLGWDGGGGATLRVVAESLGVSHEWVRQVQAGASERLVAAAPDTPALDAALAVLEETQPATLHTAAAEIAKHGLARAAFDPRGVLRAAKLLGRRTKLVVERGRPPILTRQGFHDVAAGVDIACSLALAGRAAATVDDVTANLSADWDATRWRILVADLVDANAGLEWLDARRRTFALDGLGAAVRDAIVRIVERDGECMIGRAVDELAGDPEIGVGLDREVVEHLCTQIKGFEIEGELIRARAREPEEYAADADDPVRVAPDDFEQAARRAALVEVLRLCPQTSLEELCATDGEAGAWLRGSSILDLARAALEAGVDRAPTKSVPMASSLRTVDTAPHGRTRAKDDATPPTTKRRLSNAPPTSAPTSTEPAVPPSAPPARPGTAPQWSMAASSLSLSVRRVNPHNDTPTDPTEPHDPHPAADRIESQVDRSDLIAVLRRAPAPGLLMVEIEADLPGPRARLRRMLRAMEEEGIVRRSGMTRSMRYELIDLGAVAPSRSSNQENTALERAAPIRRRRPIDSSPATRTIFYRRDAHAQPEKVAAVVLNSGTITIAYAPEQPRLDALERIATGSGVLTPSDGLRFWSALPSAFATSSHFFVTDGGDGSASEDASV